MKSWKKFMRKPR
ncbi:hypothetical protein N7458_000003 [Penicillium daleae]|uniref:Uncharacterized protein n=1 Tax=Penicillium daleae TaxID=63821 RepID=A0AAD6CGZ0_9EURO|nr:hypothetical protein N7458_000003 [Penicillium daleae]